MKKTLESQKLNRSQTFGTHLYTFADQINAGDAAIKDNDFSVATLCFEAAKKEYDSAPSDSINIPFNECCPSLT